MKTKGSDVGPNPELCALMGKHVGIYSEGETADSIELNFTSLKQISGEDTITARRCYRDPIEFKAVCKLHLATNFTPGANDEKAIVDRLDYIFMDSTFSDKPKKGEQKKDTDFIERLRSIHLSEVFSWMAQGSYNFYKDGRSITVPPLFKARTTELFKTEDSISTFVNRMLIITENKKDYIKKGVLFEDYMSFCVSNSQKCHRRSELFDRLKEMKLVVSVKDGYDIYRNVKLSSDHERKKPANTVNDTTVSIEDDTEYKEAYENCLKHVKDIERVCEDRELELYAKEHALNKALGRIAELEQLIVQNEPTWLDVDENVEVDIESEDEADEDEYADMAKLFDTQFDIMESDDEEDVE
jgi:phage/plasmid-associated DNA primase